MRKFRDVSGRRTVGPFELEGYAGYDLLSVHRLVVRGEWYDDDRYGVVVSWGDGNSDPVCHVGASLRLPDWWPGVRENRAHSAKVERRIELDRTTRNTIEMVGVHGVDSVLPGPMHWGLWLPCGCWVERHGRAPEEVNRMLLAEEEHDHGRAAPRLGG